MEGYAKLAGLMGAHPEVAVFRRFGAMNAQNLLHLQAELTSLELKLKDYAKEDAKSGHPKRVLYSRHWQTLSNSINVSDHDDKQWSTMLTIRDRLKEYSKSHVFRRFHKLLQVHVRAHQKDDFADQALLQQSMVAKLDSPSTSDLEFMKTWMKAPSMGKVYLLGSDADVWEKPDRFDLIALRARKCEDSFSLFLSNVFIHWYHRFFGLYIRVRHSHNHQECIISLLAAPQCR